MEANSKRPVLVNIALAVLLVLSLSVFVNIVYLAVLSDLSLGTVIVLSLMLCWAIALLWLFRAVLRRKNYGRYLTILYLTFLWLIGLRSLIFFLMDQPGFAVEANSYSEWLGGWALFILQFVTFLPLAIAFAFSKRVSRYFNFHAEIPDSHLPPPPPTFDGT